MKSLIGLGACLLLLSACQRTSPATVAKGEQETAKSEVKLFAVRAPLQLCIDTDPPDSIRGRSCSDGYAVTPARVYADAQASGRKGQIVMWVYAENGALLDQALGSADAMKDWAAKADAAMAYMRDTAKSADGYAGSLQRQKDAFAAATKRQGEILNKPSEKLVDPARDFRASLTAKGAAEKAPAVAELASNKLTTTYITDRIADSRRNVEALQGEYASVVTQYQAHRATESAASGRLRELAAAASTGTIATLPAIERDIVVFARQEGQRPNEIMLAAVRLSALLRGATLDLYDDLAGYRDFMNAQAVDLPDMTSPAIRSLENMLAYCEGRRASTDMAVARMLDGTTSRRQALVSLAADEATKATIAGNAQLAASTTFLDEATRRVNALWAAPVTSTRLKLAYVAGQYDRVNEFAALEPLCDGTVLAWRATGCNLMRRHFTTAKSYRDKDLPLTMTLGIGTMRAKGVAPALLADVQAKLKAKQYREAANSYDEAVRASEAIQ